MLTVVGILVVLLFVGVGIASVVYEIHFGRRYEIRESYAYTIKDFEGLQRKVYTFTAGKGRGAGEKLVGYRYSLVHGVQPKGLIVFAHGFGGGGHRSYMPEIDAFVKSGYDVFAYDVTGCDESEGKTVKGLQQGPIVLDEALTFIQHNEELRTLPIVLYGHSWGAYSVMSTLAKEHPIQGAIAHSGFNQTTAIIIQQGASKYGKGISVLKPFIRIYEWLKFGSASKLNSIQGLENTKVPVLRMHSQDDATIGYKEHFLTAKEKLRNANHITWITFSDRDHDCLRTKEIQEQVRAISKDYKSLKERYGSKVNIPKHIRQSLYLKNKMTHKVIDTAVVKECIQFYDRCLIKEEAN